MRLGMIIEVKSWVLAIKGDSGYRPVGVLRIEAFRLNIPYEMSSCLDTKSGLKTRKLGK